MQTPSFYPHPVIQLRATAGFRIQNGGGNRETVIPGRSHGPL